MQTLVRLTVLGIFAALGVALAISVAANAPPIAATEVAPDTARILSPAPPEVELPATVARPPVPLETVPVAISKLPAAPPELPPWAEAYQQRDDEAIDSVLKAIDRIEARQDEASLRMTQLQLQLPNPSAPPAAPANPQEPPTPPESTAEELPETSQVEVTPDGDTVTLDLQDADIRYALKLLGKAGGFNMVPSPNVSGTISAALQDVPIDDALGAILKSTGYVYRREGDMVYVGTPDDLQTMQYLDEEIGTRVYHPNYISAKEIEKLVTPLLSAGVGRVTVSSPPEVGVASDATKAGGDSYTGSDIVMVRDYRSILDHIDQVVAEVDCMPRQVAIEATILSVSLNDQDVLGVDFELLRQKDTIRITSGNPLTTLASANFTEGLKIGFLDSSLSAFIEALETVGETHVVAAPRVMCLNKQRAEILIGSELGYVNTTVTQTSATQAVEFLEVGTHLLIRPYISSDGMVRMEVHPELSTGSVRVEGGFTLPDNEVTQVTTNIMCRSGATIVLGGLIREDITTSSSQIPVLGNLPVVGVAFRQRSEEINRREIIVLLTPRVIDEQQAGAEGQGSAAQILNRQEVFVDKLTPLGKRHIGERHFRQANAAYAAGDLDTALRYANMAIHFDSLHQGAINLRTEILAVAPELEVSVKHHLRHGLRIDEYPHHDYSRDGYPWREPMMLPEFDGHYHVEDAMAPVETAPSGTVTTELAPIVEH